jgi:hypothetical protein
MFCASPTRNSVDDLDLFAGTGVLDKMPDVDDALVADAVALVLILGIGIAVIVIGVGVVIAVILVLTGWMRVGCARLCGVHRAPSLWAGARERGNARRARFTKS